MRIDAKIEAQVREVLNAIVKKDKKRLQNSFGAIRDNENATNSAIELALAICSYVILELHGGRRPSADEIDSVADNISHMENWAGVRKDYVVQVVTGLFYDLEASKHLPTDEAVTLPFVIAASLLASTTEAKDGNRWFDYLDDVEDKLESVP